MRLTIRIWSGWGHLALEFPIVLDWQVARWTNPEALRDRKGKPGFLLGVERAGLLQSCEYKIEIG